MKIGILGGGLTGLTLAKLLTDHEVEVLESYSRPGGLCRSFEVDGFRGDYGGHVLFSKDKEALSFLVNGLEDNIHKVRRENRILYKGVFVKYPFENDLAAIPLQDRYECLYHFLYDNYPEPKNLEEWCYATFGKGISEKYLLPCNRKIWKTDPRELSMSWVERIPKPPKEDVIKSSLGIPTEGYTHQLYFKYPLRGGIEALVHALSKGLNIITDFRVKAIQRNRNGWTVESNTGENRQYDRIISTIPIFDLFEALEFVEPNIRSLVNQLRYNSLIVTLVCLARPRKYNFSALYVSEASIIFHRLCYMDYFSSYNSPDGCSSIITEITTNESSEAAKFSDKQIADLVVSDLVKLGQINKKNVVNVAVRRREYAYIVNDLEYENRLQKIYAYLGKIDLPFCGRFAEFRYHNMDACVRSAFKVAKKIKEG